VSGTKASQQDSEILTKLPSTLSECLMAGIQNMKQLLAMKCSSSQENQEEINQRMEQTVVEATRECSDLECGFLDPPHDSHDSFVSRH
jgi:hypothetical protein